nr:hypothetical protein [Tanacetum cinerariifolium]
MEILLEPTSNKLMISLTKAGNPVKKILLKLNLSDHMSILIDFQETLRWRCEAFLAYPRTYDLLHVESLFTYECHRQLEPGTFTSILMFPTLKQLAIKRWDEYGFVIRPVVTSLIQIETYHELVGCWLKQDFHLHREYLNITQMLWKDHKDNA